MLGIICLCLSSCYTPKILKFNTKTQIQKELESNTYYDQLTNTKFYKYRLILFLRCYPIFKTNFFLEIKTTKLIYVSLILFNLYSFKIDAI